MAELREVELLEDGVADDAPASPGSGSHRRRWWWGAAALVAAVAVVVGGQALLDARHRAHLARFDDVPGVLLPVPHRLHVRWERTSEMFGPRLDDAVDAAGLLVSGTLTGGRYTIVGTDRLTGEPRWTVYGHTDASDDDTSDDAASDDVVATTCMRVGEDELVACALGQVGPQWIPASPTATRIVVIDATDGTVVSSRSTSIQTWFAADGTVVTATSASADGSLTWTLEAVDPHGTRLWTHTLPAVPVVPDVGDQPTYTTELSAAAGRVAFTSEGRLWVLAAGKVVMERAAERHRSYTLQDGGVVVSYPGNDADQAGFISRDGHWVPVVGTFVPAGVDDGSADEVVLSYDDVLEPGTQGRLVARDATTGAERWTRPADIVSSAVVLGGTVYAVIAPDQEKDEQVLVALDARTGKPRWSHKLAADLGLLGNVFPATDGRAVYALGDQSVAAFAIDDGARLPAVETPPSIGTDDGIESRLGLLVRSHYDQDTGQTKVLVLG